jgi:hypothetical protein
VGRTHLYENLIDEDYLTLFKMALTARMRWPKDDDDVWIAVREFNDNIDAVIDEIIKLGRHDLIETMIEEGVEIRDE